MDECDQKLKYDYNIPEMKKLKTPVTYFRNYFDDVILDLIFEQINYILYNKIQTRYSI